MRHSNTLFLLGALATCLGLVGCGDANNDDVDPVTFLSVGFPKIFNYTCSNVEECPPTPDLGSVQPFDDVISMPYELWSSAPLQQFNIEVKAIDDVGVARITILMISDVPIQLLNTGGGVVDGSIVTFDIPEGERAFQSIVNLEVLANQPNFFRVFATAQDAASLDDIPLGYATEVIRVLLEE